MKISTVEEYFEILGGKKSEFPKDTAKRVYDFSKELRANRKYSKITSFESESDTMVVINGLRLFSFCEHHLLPYFGYCSIGYIPNGKVLGLSKFQRIVEKCASKPTIQENLTQEIADTLTNYLGEDADVGVAVTCIHSCMFGRGVKNADVGVNTIVLKNGLRSNNVSRTEFLNRITKHENILR